MKVTFHHPDFDKGVEFGIAGIGVVKNGDSVELSKEQLDAYEAHTGTPFKDSCKENPCFAQQQAKTASKQKRRARKTPGEKRAAHVTEQTTSTASAAERTATTAPARTERSET